MENLESYLNKSITTKPSQIYLHKSFITESQIERSVYRDISHILFNVNEDLFLAATEIEAKRAQLQREASASSNSNSRKAFFEAGYALYNFELQNIYTGDLS